MFRMMQKATKNVALAESRYRNLTRDFKHGKYENSTKVVKYTRQLKGSNINFSIKHSIASKVRGNPSSIICYALQKNTLLRFVNKK